MSKRRFIYFDLGNVLVNFDHQVAVDQLAALAGRDTERVRAALFDSGLQHRYETGLVTSTDFAKEVNQQLETRLAENDILESTSAIFSPNDPIVIALERVKAAGIAMGILSNTCEAHWNWILEQSWTMPGDWFQCHILSYQVQSMKPDSRIYEVCESVADCAPDDIFFTDDRQENIEAATARGWATYLYQSPSELLSQLGAWIEG